jgi:hypothetical protein
MKAVAACLLLTVTAAAAAQAPPALQQSPAGRQVVAWLEAFNRGDSATLRRFRAEHAPDAHSGSLLRPSPQMMSFRGMTGGASRS